MKITELRKHLKAAEEGLTEGMYEAATGKQPEWISAFGLSDGVEEQVNRLNRCENN